MRDWDPNRFAIHDVGDHGGTAFAVMELLDGARQIEDCCDSLTPSH